MNRSRKTNKHVLWCMWSWHRKPTTCTYGWYHRIDTTVPYNVQYFTNTVQQLFVCLMFDLFFDYNSSTTVVCSAQSISYCAWHKNWYNYIVYNIKSLSWKFSRNEYTSCVVFINLVCLISWLIDQLLFFRKDKKEQVLRSIFFK